MTNPNRPDNARIRPLASIPNKDGFQIVGVHRNGSEALLTVYMNDAGFYVVPGYADLVGWKFP